MCNTIQNVWIKCRRASWCSWSITRWCKPSSCSSSWDHQDHLRITILRENHHFHSLFSDTSPSILSAGNDDNITASTQWSYVPFSPQLGSVNGIHLASSKASIMESSGSWWVWEHACLKLKINNKYFYQDSSENIGFIPVRLHDKQLLADFWQFENNLKRNSR